MASNHSASGSPVANLNRCPYEITMRICSYFECQRDINSLARTTSRLYMYLNPELYETNVRSDGSSALFWAAAKGREGTIRHMIEFGADIHRATNPCSKPYLSNKYCYECSGTALHIAVKFGHLNLVDSLIKEGLDIHQTTVSDCGDAYPETSPLELAIEYGHSFLATLLIKKGSNVNRCVEGNRSALSIVLSELSQYNELSFGEQAQLLQILLQSGAVVNPPPRLDPFITVQASPLQLVFRLAEYGLPERVPLFVQMLLDHGADVNTIIFSGNHQVTPLHLASILGLKDIVECLLEKGADIEAKDNWGQTPLFYAVAMGAESFSLLHPLDERQWDWAFRNDAIRRLWRGSVEVVQMLLEHGADTEVMDINDNTPQIFAAENHNGSFRVMFGEGLVSKKREEKCTEGGSGQDAPKEERRFEELPWSENTVRRRRGSV